MMLERLQDTDTKFRIESYSITRAAADRLLRTVGVVPEEPRRLPPGELNDTTQSIPPVSPVPYAAPSPALSSTLYESTQLLPRVSDR